MVQGVRAEPTVQGRPPWPWTIFLGQICGLWRGLVGWSRLRDWSQCMRSHTHLMAVAIMASSVISEGSGVVAMTGHDSGMAAMTRRDSARAAMTGRDSARAAMTGRDSARAAILGRDSGMAAILRLWGSFRTQDSISGQHPLNKVQKGPLRTRTG